MLSPVQAGGVGFQPRSSFATPERAISCLPTRPSPSSPCNLHDHDHNTVTTSAYCCHYVRACVPQVSKDWRDSKEALGKYGYFDPMLI